VGLDVAHEMVAVARARHPELDFRQGDAQRLVFADESLDAVVGNFAILHFGRPEQAVAEFVRVLKPAGAAALSTWNTPDWMRMIGVFLDAANEVGAVPLPHLPAGPPFFRFADESESTRLLRDAGLGEVSVRTFAYRHRFSSPDDLWEAMRSSTVRMRALVFEQPAQVLAAIRAAFDRRVAEYATDDGGLDMPISVKVVAGFRERTGSLVSGSRPSVVTGAASGPP
jgi:SAM-dependent methyltransferase